ncbi:hypothetical protein M5D96_007790 [Drosophila gunungcola]|uniref:Uncharacterized protein n=1 Tax=Drosophila gunungcola TaxID=103775 RepID=A0A9P9YLV8_9MUSC|nr:hypothetical protein M5D96_007790 [Drosophila gunungcola]
MWRWRCSPAHVDTAPLENGNGNGTENQSGRSRADATLNAIQFLPNPRN